MSPEARSLTPVLLTHSASPARTRDKEVCLTADERERRRQAFQDLMCGIPRLCSPALIATTGPSLADSSPQSFDPDFKFNWSIDQMAALQPADFSCEINGSFYRLDGRAEAQRQDEDRAFFDRSFVLPSPDAEDTSSSDNFIPLFAVRVPPAGSRGLGTPSRGVGDMSVSQTKFPTPVNASKAKQKKKLFPEADSVISEVMTELSGSDSNANMHCFRSESMTSPHLMDSSSCLDLSPIPGEGSRLLEMGAEDDTFSRESESIPVMVSNDSCIDDVSQDSGSRRMAARGTGLFSAFTFQTSTPTLSHS